MQKRIIGTPITLNQCITELSKQDLSQKILQPLWQNGTICIKQQNLSPQTLAKLAQKLGQPVLLPEAFGFNNLDDKYKEIVRVGNMNKDGSIRKNTKDAEYWHHDGDFWPSPLNRIVNMLHAKTVPKTGGKTGILDVISPLEDKQLFPKLVIEKLRRSQILVKTTEIADFKNAPPEQQLPDQTHDVIQKHPVTGQEFMYLPFCEEGIYDKKEGKNWISPTEIIEMLQSSGYFYQHSWEEGDILIWDNLSVMHRSMGGFGNEPRLLFRAQARYLQDQQQQENISNNQNKQSVYQQDIKL